MSGGTLFRQAALIKFCRTRQRIAAAVIPAKQSASLDRKNGRRLIPDKASPFHT
jgi:hypothetical protein